MTDILLAAVGVLLIIIAGVLFKIIQRHPVSDEEILSRAKIKVAWAAARKAIWTLWCITFLLALLTALLRHFVGDLTEVSLTVLGVGAVLLLGWVVHIAKTVRDGLADVRDSREDILERARRDPNDWVPVPGSDSPS